MKYFIVILFFLITKVHSQNLVPNYSFESHTNCPTSGGQLNFSFPWYDPTGATSDYFNSCANPSFFGVPFNANNLGFQYAHSGNAYAGFFTVNGGYNNYREYVQVQINDTLISGKCYYVEFYVSLANSMSYASNNIGAYLSQAPITTTPPNILAYSPQILLTGNPVITDTLNWVKIYSVYSALGGEKYITVGNFSNTTNTNISINDTSYYTIHDTSSYYYIDDVSIYEIRNANAGRDTTICIGESVELSSTNYEGIVYSWQPNTGLSNPAIGNPVANPSQTTTYYLTQTNPCSVSNDTVTVNIQNCDTTKTEFTIPNAFSPNNDGHNDLFKLQGWKNLTKFTILIYDRWGEKVFESNDPEIGWDGTYKGKLMNPAVFVYYINATISSGEKIIRKGNISLIR